MPETVQQMLVRDQQVHAEDGLCSTGWTLVALVLMVLAIVLDRRPPALTQHQRWRAWLGFLVWLGLCGGVYAWWIRGTLSQGGG